MPNINRRKLITGLICLAAAPAIVRVDNLMRINPIRNLTVYVDATSRGPVNLPFIFATLQEAMDFIDVATRSNSYDDVTVHLAPGVYEHPGRPALPVHLRGV